MGDSQGGSMKFTENKWRGKIYGAKVDGKIVYIGQTQQTLANRVKAHIKEYPYRQKWTFFIIKRFEEDSVLTLWEKLDKAERFFIQKYNTRSPKGYNKDDGGVNPAYRISWLKKRFPQL